MPDILQIMLFTHSLFLSLSNVIHILSLSLPLPLPLIVAPMSDVSGYQVHGPPYIGVVWTMECGVA